MPLYFRLPVRCRSLFGNLSANCKVFSVQQVKGDETVSRISNFALLRGEKKAKVHCMWDDRGVDGGCAVCSHTISYSAV